MKSVKPLAMKMNFNMYRIKGTKSSVLEYHDLSGYYSDQMLTYYRRCCTNVPGVANSILQHILTTIPDKSTCKILYTSL